jgi:hypothetical protein
MVEAASAKFVVIVDETKLVNGLGGSGLAMPVEVVQFCWKYNAERLKTLPEVAGCEVKLRMDGDKPYVTDNSNYIIDLYFKVIQLASICVSLSGCYYDIACSSTQPPHECHNFLNVLSNLCFPFLFQCLASIH